MANAALLLAAPRRPRAPPRAGVIVEAISAAIEAGSRSPRFRAALLALGRVDEVEDVAPVRQGGRDPVPRVRAAATPALAQLSRRLDLVD